MGQADAAHNTIFAETLLLRAFVGLSAACVSHTTPHHVNHKEKFSVVVSNTHDPVLPSAVCICEVKWKGRPNWRGCAFQFASSGQAAEKPGIFTWLLLFSRWPGVSSDAPPAAPQCQAARERDTDAPEAGILLLGARGSVYPVLLHALPTDGVGKPQRGALKSHAADWEVRGSAWCSVSWWGCFVNQSAWLANY